MPLYLSDIRDWLKTIYPAADYFYCGKLDNKKEKSIGVYQRRPSGAYRIPMGGIKNKSFDEKAVSVLVHWTKQSSEAEKAAFSLYETIRDACDVVIHGTRVLYIRMDTPEPVDVGTDDNGVYERVIWITIYYDREG